MKNQELHTREQKQDPERDERADAREAIEAVKVHVIGAASEETRGTAGFFFEGLTTKP